MAKGAKGDARRGWVSELVLGRDAAIPYDEAKISLNLQNKPKKTGMPYDLHVDLATPKLPGLRTLVLGETAYVAPDGVEDDDSYLSLIGQLKAACAVRRKDVEAFMEDLGDEFGWFFSSLAQQNDDLIATFLAPIAPTLTKLRAPFTPSNQWTDVPMEGRRKRTITARLPSTLADAKELHVILRSERPHKRELDAEEMIPRPPAVQALSRLLPETATVDIQATAWTADAWRGQPRPVVRSKTELWAWTWVDEDGVRTPFGQELLQGPPQHVVSQESQDAFEAQALLKWGAFFASGAGVRIP